MHLKCIHDDGTLSSYPIIKEPQTPKICPLGYIDSHSKVESALGILHAYIHKQKAVLFDESNQSLQTQIKNLGIQKFPSDIDKKTIFDAKHFQFIYYTSGTTGHPLAALKTKENLQAEVEMLSELLKKYQIKKVLVTVPFIHLYGSLFGLLYPLHEQIDIVIKEHFLPFDLIDLIAPYTMVVTTPLYIKALNKLQAKKKLSHTLFVSSTAPLDAESIQTFNAQYCSDILQIFGSTETGGIAYKINHTSSWTPFPSVTVKSNKEGLMSVASPFVSKTLFKNTFIPTQGEIQTFDYIEKKDNAFTLIGRSNKIFKLAGKRYSTVQIEDILEAQKEISKALVFVGLEKRSLRGEFLDITLETKREYSIACIKQILKEKLSNLKFPIRLEIVEKIPVNQVGKKLRIL